VEDPYVTVMILEDNIKHPQYYSGGTDKEYKHKHVLRGISHVFVVRQILEQKHHKRLQVRRI